MSDRRTDGARKRTGGLIVLSVAWVGVLGLVNPSSTGKSTSNDPVLPPSPNNVMIEYLYLKDGFGTYDALSQNGVTSRLDAAFSAASQKVYWKSGFLDTTNAIWNYNDIALLYSHYKKDPNYPYWLVSVKGLYRNGVLTNALGVTEKTNPPGHDGTPSEPKSIVMYENIAATVSLNNNDWQWWRMTVVHELGHQRAALTHPEDWPGDHSGDLTGYKCVMHGMYPGTSPDQVAAILSECKFCGYAGDYNQGVRSCVRFNYERGLSQ